MESNNTTKEISALEFANQNSFSKRDVWALERMYGDKTMTAEQWDEQLKGKFTYGTKGVAGIESAEEEKKSKKNNK